ncbi:hypothetical protein MKW92_050917 [Papaver armeniacum]|nr:hypothetical protein MKW92_050917 [Papaver armeniacum]
MPLEKALVTPLISKTSAKAFYSHWKENKTNFWGASDAIVIKSSALSMSLYGLEFTVTIMVFMDKQIQFWCSQKKAPLLNEVKKSTKDTTLLNDDGTALMEDIFQAIAKSSDNGSPISDKLKTSNLQLANVTNGFWELFAVKDNTEITNHFVVPKQLEKIIDEEKKVTHSSLMEETEKAVLEPAKVNGGEFDLRPSACSNEENFYCDSASVIICAVGSLYNRYFSNVARTFLIDANAMQSKPIGALMAGSKVSAGYEAALAVVEKNGPELFCESGLNLNAKNDSKWILKSGMVFNIFLGFQNLQAQTNNVKTEKFSLLLDTVIVKENIPIVVTMISSKVVKDEMLEEEFRRQHQAKLARQKNGETTRMLAGGRSGAGDGRSVAKELPYHVATVKSMSGQQDNRTCYIRIIFDEVSFHSKDPRHISDVVNMIKTLRRQVVSWEKSFRPMRLPDLWIRPPFEGRGRKLSGTLEAHVSGVRYSTSKPDKRVYIVYGNVMHAFVQPAEKEMITLLQFHLHNHIIMGTKKAKDVQFYVEVMDVVQTLGGGRISKHDPDEIEEEQQEKNRKNMINMDFSNFVNKVNDLWGEPHHLGSFAFAVCISKALALTVPTSTCLVELIETPFLVVFLNEIEIANLECVGLDQKNFYMAIVFKDFKRDVLRIDSIPSTALDVIKEWLDTTDLKYCDSRLNLKNWGCILSFQVDDKTDFPEICQIIMFWW